jgi:hypothetical protein
MRTGSQQASGHGVKPAELLILELGRIDDDGAKVFRLGQMSAIKLKAPGSQHLVPSLEKNDPCLPIVPAVPGIKSGD